MAVGNSMMVLETGAGWTRGLKNALRAELERWFGTRMWWIQILIWAVAVNGILTIAVLSTPGQPGQEALVLFNSLLGIFGPIGVAIIMQDVLAGEKRSGTASWVLSKPVSRAAFVAAKLAANVIGVAVTMVLAQGVIGYLIISLVAHLNLPLAGFAAGLGVHLVALFFYLTLVLMLGAIFEKPAPVIGIPLAFLFFQQFLPGLWAPLAKVIPYVLTTSAGGGRIPSTADALMTGMQPPTFLPLMVAAVASVLFVVGALWAFQREEL